MRRNPRVTLLCYDPRQPLRYLEVRGTVVEMTEEGAGRHLDELASKYAGRTIRYFGEAILARFAGDGDPGPVPHPSHPRRRSGCHSTRRQAMNVLLAPEPVAIPPRTWTC